MKLGESLSKLKKERTRLARLISLRKDNVYVEEGKESMFDPKGLGEEINKKIEEIRKLKIAIQRTNLQTEIKDEEMTLAEAIIKVNDLRSRIKEMSELFEKERSYLYKEEKSMVAQLDAQDVEDEIQELEADKVQLDNKIQMTNWITILEE